MHWRTLTLPDRALWPVVAMRVWMMVVNPPDPIVGDLEGLAPAMLHVVELGGKRYPVWNTHCNPVPRFKMLPCLIWTNTPMGSIDSSSLSQPRLLACSFHARSWAALAKGHPVLRSGKALLSCHPSKMWDLMLRNKVSEDDNMWHQTLSVGLEWSQLEVRLVIVEAFTFEFFRH